MSNDEPSASSPAEDTETRTVLRSGTSRRKTSATPLVSPGTRLRGEAEEGDVPAVRRHRRCQRGLVSFLSAAADADPLGLPGE